MEFFLCIYCNPYFQVTHNSAYMIKANASSRGQPFHGTQWATLGSSALLKGIPQVTNTHSIHMFIAFYFKPLIVSLKVLHLCVEHFQWMNWLMATAGKLWLRQYVFTSCSSSCREAEQVMDDLWGDISFISIEVVLKCCLHNIPRFLWLCQQHPLFPVDTCAAVHQPCGPSASFLPPALPLPSLASGP